MTNAVRASCGLYKMLLFMYPGDFRLRFESEMVTTFSELICGEWECNGPPGVARVWRTALGEVFSVAVPLQLQNSIVIAISLSFLCSSGLFYNNLSCDDARVRQQIANWFGGSRTISKLYSP